MSALRQRRRDAIDDPLFPVAVLRADALIDSERDQVGLINSWAQWGTRETGSVRYRWEMNPRLIRDWPASIGPQADWQPWRPRDVAAWAELPERSINDIERLLTPLILADSLQLLVDATARNDGCALGVQIDLESIRTGS